MRTEAEIRNELIATKTKFENTHGRARTRAYISTTKKIEVLEWVLQSP
jgi:hypothetical protein